MEPTLRSAGELQKTRLRDLGIIKKIVVSSIFCEIDEEGFELPEPPWRPENYEHSQFTDCDLKEGWVAGRLCEHCVAYIAENLEAYELAKNLA